MRRWPLIALVLLAGCGGGDDDGGGGDTSPARDEDEIPAGAVARVGDDVIERSTYDHWAEVARRGQGAPGEQKVEPPDSAIRDQTMQFLISSRWIEQEAAAEGITVSDDEVREQYESQREQSFKDDEEYEEFLRSSGQTEADLTFRVRLDLLSNRLREKQLEGVPKDQEQAAIDEFVAEFRSRHRAETLCAPEYTIPDCRNSPKGEREQPGEGGGGFFDR